MIVVTRRGPAGRRPGDVTDVSVTVVTVYYCSSSVIIRCSDAFISFVILIGGGALELAWLFQLLSTGRWRPCRCRVTDGAVAAAAAETDVLPVELVGGVVALFTLFRISYAIIRAL